MFIKNNQSEYNNRAITFYSKGDFKTALKWFKKAYSPDGDPMILFNIGLCYHSLRDFENALKYYTRFEKENGDKDIYEKCLIYLLSGDYEKGLEIYHTRYGRQSKDGVSFPKLPLKWIDNVEDLKGTNLLVLNEQGFGDEFLFSKSFTELTKQCKSCKIQVYPETIDLFEELYPELDFFTDRTLTAQFLTKFDSYTSTGELFAQFNKTGVKQYEYNETIIDRGRVGIFFAANPESKNAKQRSIDPNIFKKLTDRYELVNLQKGYELDFTENPTLNNFLDTKRVIDKLDFVITIDSSVANLCGILGKECYLVNRKYLDWRYINKFYDSIDVITPTEINNL